MVRLRIIRVFDLEHGSAIRTLRGLECVMTLEFIRCGYKC